MQKTQAFNRAVVVVFSSILVAGIIAANTLFEVMLCFFACITALYLLIRATQVCAGAWRFLAKSVFGVMYLDPVQKGLLQHAVLHINERHEMLHVSVANQPVTISVSLKKCKITPIGCFIYLQPSMASMVGNHATVFVQKSLISEQAFRALCRIIIWQTSANKDVAVK